MRIDNYNQGYKMLSMAFDDCVRADLVGKDLNVLYVTDAEAILIPDNIIISTKSEEIEKLKEFNSYDVVEIWENGFVNRKYSDGSNDNYFFITGACNSNCVMCPSPEATRKNVNPTDIDILMELVRYIPSDAPHLTITGGEPFLIGESIFPFIKCLKEKFENTEFLFLTNGRIFGVEKYLKMFIESASDNSIVAIPIHGSCESIHDSITRADGSFKQTKQGIKNLLKNNIAVEIRLVVSKLNIDDIDNIAELIIQQFKGIEYVSVIAMEMTGNARLNMDKVWIPYKESFNRIEGAIRKMVENGVNVKIYNFPLCTVQKSFWTLCEKSISDAKVKYAETCESCKYKKACGGVFAGTYQLEKDELQAIV